MSEKATGGARTADSSGGSRKWLHIWVAVTAVTWRWLPWPLVAAAVAATVLHNRWLLPSYWPALFRPGEFGRGFRSGIVAYPLGVLLAVVAFRDRLDLAAAAWGVLAAGDGLATVVGRRAGGARWPWNPRKTIVGSLAFTGGGAVFAAVLATVVGTPSGTPWTVDLLSRLAPCACAAAAASLVESLPLPIEDNLTVPATAALVLAAWERLSGLNSPLVWLR